MKENFQKLLVFDKEKQKFFNFSRINLIFGYAQSGKTSELSKLINIFSGKDKKHNVNGTQAMPNDFNIIDISNEEGVFSHLKLSSKSLVRKAIENSEYTDEIQQSFETINKGINQAQREIECFVHSILPDARIEISHIDKPMSFLLDNLSISLENDSSSASKWQLFSVVSKLVSETPTQTLVFVDDFNSDFDEEYTMRFFEKIRESEAVFFLTTNKPIPQSLIKDDTSVFAMRNGELIEIPSLKTMAIDAITDGPEFQTFEEYMLNTWYIKESEISTCFINVIQSDLNTNILRILTSKNPIISPVPINGRVTISPRSQGEDKLYRSLFEILQIPCSQEQ